MPVDMHAHMERWVGTEEQGFYKYEGKVEVRRDYILFQILGNLFPGTNMPKCLQAPGVQHGLPMDVTLETIIAYTCTDFPPELRLDEDYNYDYEIRINNRVLGRQLDANYHTFRVFDLETLKLALIAYREFAQNINDAKESVWESFEEARSKIYEKKLNDEERGILEKSLKKKFAKRVAKVRSVPENITELENLVMETHRKKDRLIIWFEGKDRNFK